MDHRQNDQQKGPPLCITGCGFYGSAINGSMCSKCAREAQAALAAQQQNTIVEEKGANTAENVLPSPSLLIQTPPVETSSSSETVTSPSTPPAPAPSSIADSAVPANIDGTTSNNTSPSPSLASVASPPPAPSPALSSELDVAMIGTEAEGSESASAAPECRPVQTKKNRCWRCNTKVGLLGFDCRCGYTFCASHRYASSHDCDFEWKEFEREKLRQENPEAAPSKINKI